MICLSKKKRVCLYMLENFEICSEKQMGLATPGLPNFGNFSVGKTFVLIFPEQNSSRKKK